MRSCLPLVKRHKQFPGISNLKKSIWEKDKKQTKKTWQLMIARQFNKICNSISFSSRFTPKKSRRISHENFFSRHHYQPSFSPSFSFRTWKNTTSRVDEMDLNYELTATLMICLRLCFWKIKGGTRNARLFFSWEKCSVITLLLIGGSKGWASIYLPGIVCTWKLSR